MAPLRRGFSFGLLARLSYLFLQVCRAQLTIR
jgi:hypothetical protein